MLKRKTNNQAYLKSSMMQKVHLSSIRINKLGAPGLAFSSSQTLENVNSSQDV